MFAALVIGDSLITLLFVVLLILLIVYVVRRV